MMHPDDALRLISSQPVEILPDDPEEAPLDQALGRVLARDLAAAFDQPPFDKSAMDGFAWGGEPRESYGIIQTIAAGGSPPRPLAPGDCSRIMTGAPLPPGAERVHRVEWTEEASGRVRFTKIETGDNVIRRGENQRAGDLLLSRRLLRPSDIGILASSGYSAVPVQLRPVVGVISTGDELRTVGESLAPGTIYDSNGPQLAAQALAAGCEVRSYGRLPDRLDPLDAAVRIGLGECDLLLLSGGVSLGDFDYIPEVLSKNGVEKLFHNLAMKPGKPTYLGRRGNTFVLGLPGNPVSTYVNFEIMAKAVLARLRGLPVESRVVRARMADDISRRDTERVEFLPVRYSAGEIHALRYTGSSMLNVLSEANALIRLEIGQAELERGTETDARLL